MVDRGIVLQFLLLNYPQKEFECKYFQKRECWMVCIGGTAYVVSG